MHKNAKFFLVIALIGFCLIGCFDAPSSLSDPNALPDNVRRAIQKYKTLNCLSPEPVLVEQEFGFAECVGTVKPEGMNDGPHANAAIVIYMNDTAANAFHNATTYPVGSLIVKEKLHWDQATLENVDINREPSGIGGMTKREPGYDRNNGDWQYFYYANIDSIETGKLTSCIECHSKAKNQDYVFGTWDSNERDNNLPNGHRY